MIFTRISVASDQKEHVLEAGDSPGQKPLMSGLSARAELSASTKEESGDGAGPGRAWGVWSRWLRAAKPGVGWQSLQSRAQGVGQLLGCGG